MHILSCRVSLWPDDDDDGNMERGIPTHTHTGFLCIRVLKADIVSFLNMI